MDEDWDNSIAEGDCIAWSSAPDPSPASAVMSAMQKKARKERRLSRFRFFPACFGNPATSRILFLAISAFYSATCALVVWLGSHGGNRPAQDFANTWAPGLNLTSPDSWHAPLLQALSASHALYGCVEWTSESDRVPAPLAVSIALPFVQPSVGSRNSPPRYLL